MQRSYYSVSVSLPYDYEFFSINFEVTKIQFQVDLLSQGMAKLFLVFPLIYGLFCIFMWTISHWLYTFSFICFRHGACHLLTFPIISSCFSGLLGTVRLFGEPEWNEFTMQCTPKPMFGLSVLSLICNTKLYSIPTVFNPIFFFTVIMFQFLFYPQF